MAMASYKDLWVEKDGLCRAITKQELMKFMVEKLKKLDLELQMYDRFYLRNSKSLFKQVNSNSK